MQAVILTGVPTGTALRKAGITGWRRHIPLKIKKKPSISSRVLKPETSVMTPDFIFKQAKLVVFVDGCFWHQCPLHSKVPEKNHEFWEQKLRRNVERDLDVNRTLRAAGWRVLRIWEHELKEPAHAARKVKLQLRKCFSGDGG